MSSIKFPFTVTINDIVCKFHRRINNKQARDFRILQGHIFKRADDCDIQNIIEMRLPWVGL